MKKPFAIFLLLIATLTAHAQNMSFDETVKYINDKIAQAKYNLPITATSDGTITTHDKKFNLFDLPQNKVEDEHYIMQDKGIVLYSSGQYIRVHLNLTADGSSFQNITYFETEKDAERVYKALLYLRSLCTKKKDPFDN